MLEGFRATRAGDTGTRKHDRDLTIMGRYWFRQDCAGSLCEGTDINKNGSVGMDDLAEFSEYWLAR